MSEAKVRQIGRLGANPEMTFVGTGDKRVAKASIIILSNKRYTNRETGEAKETVTRLRWTLWRDQAENATKYLSKGSRVAVEGVVDNNDYQKDGVNYYELNFTVQEIEYLESKADAEARQQRGGSNGNHEQGNANYGGPDYREGDLPPA